MRLYEFRSRCSEVGAGAARWEQNAARKRAGAARWGRRREFGAAKSRCSEVWSKTTNFKVFFSQKRLFGAGAARFSAGAARFSEQVRFFGRVAWCSEVGAGAARFKKNKIIKTHCPPLFGTILCYGLLPLDLLYL